MSAKRVPAWPPDAATRIHQNIERVLADWRAQTLKAVPGASTVDEPTLRNCIPEFIRTLAEVISSGIDTRQRERASIEVLTSAKEHGVNRAGQSGYTLDQVISEYRILRQILLSFLESTGGCEAREQDKLLESIDYGIMEAAVQFTMALGFQRTRASQKEAESLKLKVAHLDENVRSISTERNVARQEAGALAKAMAELQLEREMRESFVSALTHDLRTPLTAAYSRAQLITLQSADPERVRELSVPLGRDLQRADKMIRDLLDANRIRAGQRLHLNIVPTDLAQLAATVLKELAFVHGERFVLKAPSEARALVDPDGIRRVIENLCNNAVKYGASRGPVTVTLRELASEVEIAVHNEGNPLPREEQESLFEQHHRASSAKAGEKKGWGLGLPVVKGIAESHGGRVSVESREGTGTTFTVWVPRDSRRQLEAEAK